MNTVPFPPFDDRPINPYVKANANCGVSYGTFIPTGITYDHSMKGFLSSTDNWFRRIDVCSLTPWGIGGSADGVLDGKIYRWLDQSKMRDVVPWSSGPWNPPGMGDGPAFIAKYGVHGVNGRGEAIELSDGGNILTPMSYKQWVSLIWLKAAIAHRGGVTSKNFRTILAFMHHREITKRSVPTPNNDKDCPFGRVYMFTDQYIAAVVGLMAYFEGQNNNLETLVYTVANHKLDLRHIGRLRDRDTAPLPTPAPAKPIFKDYVPDRLLTIKHHATVRQYGGRDALIYKEETRKMVPGTRVLIGGYYHGEMINGSDKWAVQANDPRGRIHESAFVERL